VYGLCLDQLGKLTALPDPLDLGEEGKVGATGEKISSKQVQEVGAKLMQNSM